MGQLLVPRQLLPFIGRDLITRGHVLWGEGDGGSCQGGGQRCQGGPTASLTQAAAGEGFAPLGGAQLGPAPQTPP